jgi:hypothetical protein
MSGLSLIDSVIDDDDEFWYAHLLYNLRDLCTNHPTAPFALKNLTSLIRISNHALVDIRYV